MALQMLREVLFRHVDDLRYQPTAKRIRARIGDETVADTVGAVLVWEPRRPVPAYAVPVADLSAELTPTDSDADPDEALGASLMGGPRLLHPGIPFAVHSAPGQAFTLTTAAGQQRVGAAYRIDGHPELADHLVLDFGAFDGWFEEDDEIRGHPRDPFHRVDIRRSSRHVRIELNGQVLAETSRPSLIFETSLPTRFYVPREDVRTDLLRPTTTTTTCAYKGQARYWSVDAGEVHAEDLVWSYEQPFPDAHELTDLMAFFDERVDVFVDGKRLERPDTPWRETANA